MATQTQQAAGSIVLVTTADTDLLTAERALAGMPWGDGVSVYACNPVNLEGDGDSAASAREELLQAVAGSSAVVLRLLGGRRALGDVFEPLVEICRANGIPLIACPGHQEWDEDLVTACTAPVAEVETVFSYLMRGGVLNFRNLFLFLADTYLGGDYGHEAPAPMPWQGVYHPAVAEGTALDDYITARFDPARPSIGLLFYRAHWMSGNLSFVDDLITRLESRDVNVLPVFSYSLKHQHEEGDDADGHILTDYMVDANGVPRVDCIVNTMGLAMSDLDHQQGGTGATVATGWSQELLDSLDVPIIQGIVSTGSRAEWEESSLGLGPIDTAMNVAFPEFDGRIITVPISFKEETGAAGSGLSAGRMQRYDAQPDRMDYLARLAARHAALRRKANADKRIAIILSNYPTKDARIGNAVGLDTPASAINLLHALQKAGYQVEDIPADGDELVHRIIERCSNDTDSLTEEQLRLAAGHVERHQYAQWYAGFPESVRAELQDAWGDPPGQVYRTDGRLAIAGVPMGNVFVGLQPPRGFGENPISVYHNPDLTPTHHYIAYYRWIRDVFGADAMIHIGKHGTLEWLPGKGVGMSAACYPEVALDDVPLFYPFIVNNPGEGTQAKRRAHATIIDHLIPPMTTADSYGDIAKLEQLMDEHYQCQTLDPAKLPTLEAQIWEMVQQAELHRDLGVDEHPDDFGEFMLEIDGYLCEIKDAQIKDGLHTLGQPPTSEQMVGLLCALTRLDNGAVPSLRRALAEALGYDYYALLADPAAAVNGATPAAVQNANGDTPLRNAGDVIEALEALCRQAYQRLCDDAFAAHLIPEVVSDALGQPDARTESVLSYVDQHIYPSLLRTTDEIDNLLRGLEGRFVPPGPSGAPTRGMVNVLPTGRNFYSVDPRALPSPTAWDVGKDLGDALLQKYLDEEGGYPEMVGVVVWGTSAMRTHGDDIAQILYLLGVKPVWQAESRRVSGLEVIPLGELGRPRIDVTVRISGFFRDAFPNLIHLIDQAVALAAAQDESPEDNYVVKHVREDAERRAAAGTDNADDATESAGDPSLFRIFGSKPGAYGAGILGVLDERNWESVHDLAEVYTAWGGYAYSRQDFGVTARNEFRARFGQIVIAAKNQDNREHDVFDSDDYMQYHGGMIATVRSLTGRNPRQFFGDSSDPSRARVRDLQDEARRVFRSRVVNPKWMQSMQRHGYKGAFELAATVDYMFGYDATAQVIEDWMYEDVTEEYVLNPEMQEFFRQSNPWALRGIVERLLEAIQRGLWENPPPEMLDQLRRMYLELETDIEARQENNARQDAGPAQNPAATA
ncbi:MAG: cobaltochelatase subunit CobN [Chloroflexi bacterium]|nr:cobaltochelatase subunit CobN [Chloroflexota bacterium]MYD49329.1 cobaltochelatase subunit CobN [Chloroflexota bacterium]